MTDTEVMFPDDTDQTGRIARRARSEPATGGSGSQSL